jgi:hypothetical protein
MHEFLRVLEFIGILVLVFCFREAIRQYGVRKRRAGTETFWTRNLLEKRNRK